MHAQTLDNVTPLPHALPYQGVATIVRQDPDGGLWVRDGRGERCARRAAGCLLEPAIGDRVWVVGEAGGESWVISVLERGSEGPAVLSAPGDVTIRAEGTLTMAGGEGLQMTTPHGLGVSADELQVQAKTGRAAISELSLVVRSMFASVTKATRVGQVLDLLVDRVTQRSAHSVRVIEGLDRTQAQTLDLRASGDAHIQATHALVNGKNLVKMDGGQIHLG